jgi:dTDP-4-amino-4,6-dideoxygalactose transaminase
LGALGYRVVGPPAGVGENGYLSVTLVQPDRRQQLQTLLAERGIGYGTVYPGAMSEQPGAAGHHVGHVGGSSASWLGRSVLNLPLFAYIRDDEVDEVLAVMAEAAPGAAPDSASAPEAAVAS